jgi:putative oxidoreductase
MIARLLLGAIFVIFGANLWFHFLPMGPMPMGVAAQFFGALASSHFIQIVAVFQVVPGLLLLFNRFVPLALALLAPVIFNIDLTHILMAPSGLPMAAVVTLLWIVVFTRVHAAFHPLIEQRPAK